VSVKPVTVTLEFAIDLAMPAASATVDAALSFNVALLVSKNTIQYFIGSGAGGGAGFACCGA